MKTPRLTQVVLASALTLAFSLAPYAPVHAELVNEEIQEDTITPEGGSLVEEELVIVKKPAKKVKKTKKRVVVQPAIEEEEEEALPVALSGEPAYEPVMIQSQSQVQVQAAPKKSVGTSLDEGIQTKMDDVKSQFENALLRQLDKIKITVDDGIPAPEANMTTTIVQDSVVNAQGAPVEGYMPVEAAPAIALESDEELEGGESVAEAEEKKEVNSVRLSPVIGWTTINSDIYNVDSRYTAGINIEVDMSENLAIVLGYSYSQFDIGLGGSNPFNGFYQPNFYSNNTTTLQYNQNVFDAGLRFYLFPQESKFRVFVGGGLGYNKGYLNYRKGVFNTFAANPYSNLEDYEVTSYLGMLETGAELKVAKNISVGANFKYANVLSSSENQPLNNYGFAINGFGNNVSQDQRVVGGSLAENSFYSILGAVKVSF